MWYLLPNLQLGGKKKKEKSRSFREFLGNQELSQSKEQDIEELYFNCFL